MQSNAQTTPGGILAAFPQLKRLQGANQEIGVWSVDVLDLLVG